MHSSLEGDGLGQLVVWSQHPWKTSGFSQYHWQKALLIPPAAVRGVGDPGARGESRASPERLGKGQGHC